MKKILIWFVLIIVVYAGAALGFHLYKTVHPSKVLVILDASYPMLTRWGRIDQELKKIQNARYALFSLATDKTLLHSWNRELLIQKTGQIKPYGTSGVAEILESGRFQEIKEASSIIIITSDPSLQKINRLNIKWVILE